MEWTKDNKEIDDSVMTLYTSFVYKITNLLTNKKYIGKKKLKFFKRKKIKGRINRKKIIYESDWKKYYGSNEALKEDVKTYGEDNFKREILRFCKTISEASYYESKFIFEYDALLSDNYYNSWISVRLHSKTLNFK